MSYINKRKKSVKSLSDLPEKLLVWQENDRSNDSNSFVLASDLAKRNNCFRLWKKSPTTRVKLHIKYIMVTIKTTPDYNSVGKDEA